MSRFEKSGIVIGILTSLGMFFGPIFYNGDVLNTTVEAIVGCFICLLFLLCIEASIFLCPRVFLWIKGDLAQFTADYSSRKRSVGVEKAPILMNLQTCRKSYGVRLLADTAIIFSLSFFGSMIVGANFWQTPGQIPDAILGFVNFGTLIAGFFIVTAKQKARNWEYLRWVGTAVWVTGLSALFLPASFSFFRFLCGFPFVFLAMWIGASLAYGIRKTPL